MKRFKQQLTLKGDEGYDEVEQAAGPENLPKLFLGRNRVDLLVPDVLPDLVGRVAAEDVLQSGVVEEGGDGEGRDAEVDQRDVEELERSHVAEEVHGGGEGEEVVEDLQGPVVPVVGHDVDEVDDADNRTHGGVEAEDDEEPLVRSSDAVAQEVAEKRSKIILRAGLSFQPII